MSRARVLMDVQERRRPSMSLTRSVDDVGGGGVSQRAFPVLDVGHSRLPKTQLIVFLARILS